MWKKLLVGAAALLVTAIVGALSFVPGMVDRGRNTIVPAVAVIVTDSAMALHRQLFVADLHADQLLWARDPLTKSDYGHVDVPRLQLGNVALQVFATVTKTPRGMNYDQNTGETDNITLLALVQRWPIATWTSLRARALHQASRLHDAAQRSNGELVVITDRASLDAFVVRRQTNPRLTAGLLAVEGLHALDGKLESVDTLFAHGFRMLGLTHFFDNEVAASAHGVSHAGLTPLGKQVIARMEALGILVDVAHSSPQTISEVLALATRPIVVSHTGVAATCKGPRNLTDEQLKAIAANGGVVGIGYWDGAICTPGAASTAKAIRHAANIAGVEHVALGSDFDGATGTPFATDGVAQVTAALMAEHFSTDEIGLIMGGNVLRLLRGVLH
jgi:membrane dipeptidase